MDFPELRQNPDQRLHDLRFLLYRDGASLNPVTLGFRTFEQARADKLLGRYIPHRSALVQRLYHSVKASSVSGRSHATVYKQIRSLHLFFAWADANDRRLDLRTAESAFYDWCDALYSRTRPHSPAPICLVTACGYAYSVDVVLANALGLPRSLISGTVLGRRRRTQLRSIDREDGSSLAMFGRTLVAICSSLSADRTMGPLPVEVDLGGHGVHLDWCQLRPDHEVKALADGAPSYVRAGSLRARRAWEADGTARTRATVLNTRVKAELLIFIAQTSMNLAQAQELKRTTFQSYVDGDDLVYVRAYKHRRQGEVVFRAFRSYRSHLKRYLEWLDACAPPGDDRLFPVISKVPRPRWKSTGFESLKRVFTNAGLPFYGPRVLRNARVNWIGERLGTGALGAEAAQHLEATNRTYRRPQLSRAIGEISAFHRITEGAIDAAGPGKCVSPYMPRRIESASADFPEPDCANPAGCLFCQHHRDVESLDYAWCLASYQALKRLELKGHNTAPLSQDGRGNAALQAVERVEMKLLALSAFGDRQRGWVHEARCRVRDGAIHPMWRGFFLLMESN